MNPHPVGSLSALLDGELLDAERRAVEAHLAACPPCARHLRELTAVDALARGLPPVAAPEGYPEALPGRVRRRIRADRPGSERAAPQRAAWLWPLAAGLALAVLAPIVLRDGPAPTPPADDRGPAQARLSPAPPAAMPADPEEEARPRPPRDFVSEKDTRPLARARQDTPRRTAPAAAPDAPPAAPPPPATESLAASDSRAARAFALRDEAPVDAAVESKRAEAPARTQGQVGGVASALRKAERGNVASSSDAESAFHSTAALPLSTAPQARRARQAWLRFLADHPRAAQADEARVRVVEASVAAFRAGADRADRVAAERDAIAYLEAPEAPQAARVRSVLRRLDEPR